MENLVTSRLVNDVAILDTTGQLDLHTSPKLSAALDETIARGQVRVIVNLSKTTYLDSTALAVLTAALQQIRDIGGQLHLVFAQPQIHRLFTISGLSEIFSIFPTETEALDALRPTKAVSLIFAP